MTSTKNRPELDTTCGVQTWTADAFGAEIARRH